MLGFGSLNTFNRSSTHLHIYLTSQCEIANNVQTPSSRKPDLATERRRIRSKTQEICEGYHCPCKDYGCYYIDKVANVPLQFVPLALGVVVVELEVVSPSPLHALKTGRQLRYLHQVHALVGSGEL